MVSTGVGKHFAHGELIVRQGESADRLHVVLDGEVELVREEDGREISLGVLSSGAMIGELAILDGEVHLATAKARGEVRLLTVDKKLLLRSCKEDPYFALRILQRMAQRVRDLTTELAALKRTSVP